MLSDNEAHALLADRLGPQRIGAKNTARALALRRGNSNTKSAADIHERLGHLHTALGNHDQARAVRREALALFREQDADLVLRELG